jgi:hypothetical protein
MPSPRTLLREIRLRPEPARALELLKQLSGLPLAPQELFQFHEQLLFGKAYPRTREIRRFCAAELRAFYRRVQALGDDERTELDQSGIVGTRIFYPYDDHGTRWLRKRLGASLNLDWSAYDEKEDDPLSDVLPLMIEPALGDAADEPDLSSQDLVEAWRGPKTALDWILDGFLRIPPPARAHLYEQLALPLVLDLVPQGPSRTLLDDGEPEELFLWDPDEARRPFDLLREVQRPLDFPGPASEARGRQLLDLTYGTLLPRLRELYPATFGNPAEVYDIPLERGIRIILWFMKPEMRLPLEVGWGLLLLKNNVPIGYGAGGMLEDRSEIAINVFDTFRGGEAGWLYSQYARVFHALGAAPWLVTRKYQIGYENEEGIASGAYWFYDKLGFRSTVAAVRKLADAERRKIAKQKGYRTPRRILKKLCEADVVLSVEGREAGEYREFPLGTAGLAAGKVIGDVFEGKREGLEGRILEEMRRRFGVSTEGWTARERTGFAQMGLFALAVPGLEKWPPQERQAVLDLCRLKGSACEADYARAFRRNRKLFAELRKAAEEKRTAGGRP